MMDKTFEIKHAKEETLNFIKNFVTKAFINDIMVIHMTDFIMDRFAVAAAIAREFGDEKIMVRASHKNDVGEVYSITKHYLSIFFVNANNQKEVIEALTKVVYSSDHGHITKDNADIVKDEFLIVQKQTKDMLILGNVFTRDTIYGRPYYVANYVDTQKSNQTIIDGSNIISWVARNVSREFIDEKFYHLIEAVKEVEEIYDECDALNIDFAIDGNDNITIFHVRNLAFSEDRPKPLTDHEFFDTKSFAKCAYLDDYHILSDMATLALTENLGTNPRPLDYSLYRELVTNYIWGEGISKLGFFKVRRDIMQRIGNKPYMSIYYAFAGLTPASIDEKLRYKLVEYYNNKLMKNKSLHGRIGMEITFTVCDFAMDDKIGDLADYGFSEREIAKVRKAIFDLTRNLLINYKSISEREDKNIAELTRIRHDIRKNNPLSEKNVMKLYGYIDRMMQAIREYGTVQFTMQSRCVLVAMRFCRSLVEKGYFSKDEMNMFLGSINTAATKFEADFDLYCQGKLSAKEFDNMYGHLRLGAFDIRTERYRNMYKDLQGKRLPAINICPEHVELTLAENIIQKALCDVGYNDITPADLIDFIKSTIKNMEYYRYECIKSLSLVLEMIAGIGENMGIDREDMSYLEIQDLLSYHSRETYIQNIDTRRDMYHAYVYLMLPEVIFGVGDIDVLRQREIEPTYITDKIAEAEVVDLKDNEKSNISGKIVALATVNSGYNWIFTRDIAGFISKYGDANSYMAKRCKALGIPAMIGCGEKIYGKVVKMNRVRIDCAGKKITEL